VRLAKKTALITGGNSATGLAAARLFLAEGARATITGRNHERLDAAASELGSGLLSIQADVTDIETTQRAVAKTVVKFGKLDIIVANAGIGALTPVGDTSLRSFDEILRTNLTAVFFTGQAAAPHLNHGASSILNGPVHAVLDVSEWSTYAATKAGVRAMTHIWHRNLRLVVSASIRSRRMETKAPIWSPLAPTNDAQVALDKLISERAPLGRMGEADEVARAALYLASDVLRMSLGLKSSWTAEQRGLHMAPHFQSRVIQSTKHSGRICTPKRCADNEGFTLLKEHKHG